MLSFPRIFPSPYKKKKKSPADLMLMSFSVSQADACHAYQIVHKNGIPDEQIVVMMYDDLAQNEEWVDIFLSFSAAYLSDMQASSSLKC